MQSPLILALPTTAHCFPAKYSKLTKAPKETFWAPKDLQTQKAHANISPPSQPKQKKTFKRSWPKKKQAWPLQHLLPRNPSAFLWAQIQKLRHPPDPDAEHPAKPPPAAPPPPAPPAPPVVPVKAEKAKGGSGQKRQEFLERERSEGKIHKFFWGSNLGVFASTGNSLS